MDRQRLSELHAKAAEARQAQASTSSSAAKVYDPKGLEGTSLGQQQNVQQAFNAAARGEHVAGGQGQGIGSPMVAKEASRNNLTPPQHMRMGPDRQAHFSGVSNDTAKAIAANEKIKASRAQGENAKMKDGQERDRD